MKRYKTQVLKGTVKSIHRTGLNETNMIYIFFTQPTWTLVGSPCFYFSFEL